VWNALKHSSTHRAASHSGHQNTVSFLLLLCNTLHTSLLAWPFFLLVVFFLENVFQEVAAHFYLWNDGREISWHFHFHVQWVVSVPVLLNLKWSMFVCPEFAWHITIQFRTVILSNLLNSFMYHLLIFFLSKRQGWRSWSFRTTPPMFSL